MLASGAGVLTGELVGVRAGMGLDPQHPAFTQGLVVGDAGGELTVSGIEPDHPWRHLPSLGGGVQERAEPSLPGRVVAADALVAGRQGRPDGGQ